MPCKNLSGTCTGAGKMCVDWTPCSIVSVAKAYTLQTERMLAYKAMCKATRHGDTV